MRPLPRSAALPASHSFKDLIDVSLGLSLLDELVVRLACWSDPGYDQVEVESADQLQALDVPLPVADPVEHRGPPTAPGRGYVRHRREWYRQRWGEGPWDRPGA